MEYNAFFYDSISIILQVFSDYLPKDYISTLKKKYQNLIKPHKSIYVEIFADSEVSRTKIQQWKFKPKTEAINSNLELSYSHQNSYDDPQLQFSELSQPTFFKTLQNIRKNLQPKLLLKKMQRPKVFCEFKDNEHELIGFRNEKTFYFQVAEYDNSLFEVKLSFKYNYEDEIIVNEISEINSFKQSDSDDFQLLIDESYQNRLRNDKIKFASDKIKESNQIVSESPIHRQSLEKIVELSALTKVVASEKQQIKQNQKQAQFKQKQEFQEIEKLLKNIDFTTVQSSKLQTFLEYLL